jgi:predicted nucleotidyltransferase
MAAIARDCASGSWRREASGGGLVIPTVLVIFAMVIHTALEDRTLQAELPGTRSTPTPCAIACSPGCGEGLRASGRHGPRGGTECRGRRLHGTGLLFPARVAIIGWMSRDEVLRTIRDNIDAVHALGVARLRLFGSVLAGAAGERSDIDLLVDFRPGEKNFDNYMDLRILLEDLFPGRRIDLITTESLHPKLRPSVIAQAEYVA